mgnify:CR=1 FL=1
MRSAVCSASSGVPDAASLSYYGLHALQHRGQEGAGIVAVDEGGTFRRIKAADW